MRPFFLLLLGLVLSTLAQAQPANTFFSTFDADRGNTFTRAKDGNIWLGAMKDERVLLVKMSTGGHVLDKHTLDFKGNGYDSESLVEIFEDTDGSIVGCGNFETGIDGYGFVFRYNPFLRTLIWARIVRSETYNVLYGITPVGSNGDYLLYGSPQIANLDDAELLRLDRNTGQIKQVQRLGLAGPDYLHKIIYHNGALYGCGRFTNGLGFNFNGNTRHALCKIDPATLKPLWSRIGPIPGNKEAQLQGRDFLIEDNALISTFSGNATGLELTQSTIFLQKTDLNGKQLWVKQYNLPEWNGEFAETVVSVPDGYFLYGQDLLSDTSRLFLLKTDKQGNPLRAVKIDFDANDELAQVVPRSAIFPTGGGLFFAATSQNTAGQFQAILGKTDFDGRLEGNCGLIKSTPVNLVAFPSPVNELVVPTFSSGNTQLSPILPALENPDLTFTKKCTSAGSCPNLPDLRLKIDSINCVNGEPRLYYSFCNTGAQEYTGTAFFGLYDKNPFQEKARLITTILHTGNKLLPGDCVQGSVSSSFTPPDLFQLDTFKQLYAVMGINQNTQTPIKISDFPFAPNRAECGYFNNLDSLNLPPQLCGTCKYPLTYLKKISSAQTRYAIQSSCAAKDGHVFMAGRQGEELFIAKLNALGDIVWTKGIDDFPPFPLDISEIAEDSEGKLVLCGTQGGSPSNRRMVVLRYDPNTQQTLWAKAFPAYKSVAAGILDYAAESAYYLYGNSQEIIGGQTKTRSEFIVLDRNSGNLLPQKSLRYLGDPNITLSNIVLKGDRFYAVGNRNDGTITMLRPVFCTSSPKNTQWENIQTTEPDTAVNLPKFFAHVDLAFDGDTAIIAGSGQVNPKIPNEGVFFYLEKRAPGGQLIWLKRYDLPVQIEDILVADNAYLVWGRWVNDNRSVLIKIGKNGQVLDARVLNAGPKTLNTFGTGIRQNLLIRSPQHLLAMDYFGKDDGSSDLFILKTDLNLNLEDPCDDYQLLTVASFDVPSKSLTFKIEETAALETAQDANFDFISNSLKTNRLCPTCGCEDRPDLTLRVGQILCAPDSSILYKVQFCNLGKTALSASIAVRFYDKNPLTQKANSVWGITLNQALAPGECKEQSLPLPAAALAYAKLYSLIGAGSNTPTPIQLTDFPLPQGVAECEYLNNLDSFVVKAPECTNCEKATTFIKSIGVANKEERLQSMCVAADGHVYMVGRQNDHGIISKLSPNGEILWVRNFKPAGQTFGNLDFVQVIEDSEGHLLLTGTANHAVNKREAMAMRYDVNANKVLWYQHYPTLNPEILGVLEKPSGGNFVLYGFSDELFGSGFFSYYKTRSHIWEISRASGEVVPALSTIFNGDPSTYLNDLVLHKGHFYGVGGWGNRDIPNSSRGMLMKLSASDGALEWMQGTLVDTTGNVRFFQPSRILVDNEQLLVLGTVTQNFNLPTQQNFVVLSKYDLDGKLLWIKRYPTFIRPVEMISLPDGYAIWGYDYLQGGVAKWQIHKLSKNGEVIAAKEINGPSGSSGTGQFFNQSQLIQLPNHLLVGNQFNMGTFTDMILIKTDLDLQIADSCGLVRDLNLSPQNVSVTTNSLFSPSEPYLVEAIKQTTSFFTDSLVINPLCPVCPCTDKPDIALKAKEVLCTPNGGAKVTFEVCNKGFVSAAQGFDLTFYDKNPLTEAAKALYAIPVEAKPGFADCTSFTVELASNLLTFKKLYAMAGVWKDVATPLSLKDFPYAEGLDECDYANNLDSFDLKFSGPNLNDLGPARSICSGQSTVLDAGPGFVAYQWSTGAFTQSISAGADGLYIVEATDQCGKKVRDSVLVKTLPTYNILRDLKLAQGDSISIGGKIYKGRATVVINPKTVTGCDSTITYRIWPDTLFCKDRSESFFQVSYIKGTNSLGRIVVPAADGSIYLAGHYSYTKSEEYIVDTLLLVKTSANGQVLWSRGLDFTPNSIIFRMIEDSEGNLVGLMRNLPTAKNKPIITAFRYNPSTNQLLWVTNILTAPAPFQITHMIAERGSGGNFVVVSENEFDNITQVYQLDRNTGALIGNECWRYNSFSKVYSGGIVQQDVLILEGIDSSPLTPNSPLPNVELRINLNTGQPIESFEWVNPNQNFFSCRAQVVDNEGNTASQLDVRYKGVREDTAIWIRKTSAKGELLWAKKFDIKEKDVIETLHLGIVALSDGYVCAAYLLGLNGMNKGVGLIKVSKNGELQWAKKMADLKYPSIYWALSPQVIAARQDTVFLTGAYTNNDLKNTVEKGMLLAKINKNGEIGNSCDLMVDMNVIVSNPTFFKRKAEVPFSTIPLNFVSAPKGNIMAKSMQFYTDCSKCLPASSNLDITCPNDLTVTLPPNTSSTVVDYNLPTATTDCPDPKITFKVIQGPGAAGSFPIGINTVCYEASNTCGAKDSCCFKITVVNPETPCDFKTGPNCMRYELLSVKLDAQGQRRYRIRLNNTCASPVQFVYIQSPNGVNAVAPSGGSVYTTAPAGRMYDVRNPNASPFASIRFKARSGGLKGGASDIFEYTLPQQSAPTFILVAVRLENGDYYEAYLNTYNCPAQPYDGNKNRENDMAAAQAQPLHSFSIYPNPTKGLLYVDFPSALDFSKMAKRNFTENKEFKLLITNSLGQIVFQQDYTLNDAEGRQISIALSQGLSNGMYQLSVIWPNGKRSSERFVLER